MSADSEQTNKPPQSKGNTGPSQVDLLMRELGATRWDPTPVGQHDFFLDEVPGESALQRALAWMRAHTIRRGRWRAFAVDEKGNELQIGHLAADLDWKVKWALEVWRRGEEYGLFRRERQCPSRLYLSGKVIRLTSNPESNRCRGRNRCTAASSPPILPGYLDRQIAKWEPGQRVSFLSRLDRQERWGRKLKRDAMAAARAIVDQHRDSLFAEFGLQRMSGTKRREPHQMAAVTVLIDEEGQADLFAAAGAATNGADSAVVQQPPRPGAQTRAETVPADLYKGIPVRVQRSEAAVHQPQNGAQVTAGLADERVEGAYTLQTLESTREESNPSSSSGGGVAEGQGSTATVPVIKVDTTSSPLATYVTPVNDGVRRHIETYRERPTAANSAFTSEEQRLSEILLRFCTPDDTAVHSLLVNCRDMVKDITEEEIGQVIQAKGPMALRKSNPLGFLMVAVPNCIQGEAFRQMRRVPQSCTCGHRGTCTACHRI